MKPITLKTIVKASPETKKTNIKSQTPKNAKSKTSLKLTTSIKVVT